jgi:diguanylate cyclase (GGDEF)-like protein/PAS domain S-box-containing protein
MDPRGTSFRRSAWKVYLGAGAVLAVVYATVPTEPAKLVVWPLVGWSSVAAVLVGSRLHRPAARSAWWLLALGLATLILGDDLYSVRNLVLHEEALFPSYVDAVYLAMYPLLAVGLALLVRRRTPRRDKATLIDAAILTGGLGLLSWAFLIDPYVTEQELTTLERLVSMAYPLGDVAVLAVLVRLAVGAGRRPPAFWLLAAGAVGLLAADSAYGYLNLNGTWHEHHLADAGWILFYVTWGAAALHPSMRELSQPVGVRPRTGRRRLALVGSAALIPPGLLLVDAVRGRIDDPVAIALTSGALFGLVLARTAGLAAEVAKNQGEERFRSLVQNAVDAVVVLDSDGAIVYQTPSTARILGHDTAALDGCRLAELVHPGDRGVLDAVLAMPAGGTSVEWRAERSDRTWRTFEVDVADLRSDRSVGGVVLTMRDITDRKRLEAELRRQALSDGLTGLANRALFVNRVGHALALDQWRGAGVAVVFLDLDDFKLVNDGLGHDLGDALLVAVARRLEEAVRPGDTVARLGGDEFAVLLEEGRMPAAAETVAARITASLAEPITVGDRSVLIGMSMGIAFGRPEVTDPADLLRDADLAMYVVKRSGKGRFERFVPAMHEEARRRLDLANDLPAAITDQQLHVLYQPIVDLATGMPVGAEALVRWRHPKYGMLSPAEFVPIAEATGHVVRMGRWVLEEACRVASTWRESGADDVYITVNVSGRQLQDASLVDDVALALASSGLPPANLALEVTESVLVGNVQVARERLAELKGLGLRVAVDDFGTGYSSLSYLGNLPVDIVKIDKSFVDRVAVDGEGEAMVRAVVDLAASLGMATVAEGIEDAEQVPVLRRLGCRTGQGYLFARPTGADEVAALLRARVGSNT